MINVLFVAWEFPPLTAGGVQRPLYFIKYLQQFNINPIVVTVEDYGSYGKLDETLLKEIPESVTVERIKCNITYPSNRLAKWANTYLQVVDNHASWWQPYIQEEVARIIAKYEPQAIYVTIPPFSMAPLWTAIAKKYKLPLVLDFRDAWSQWIKTAFGSWFHYKAMVSLEGKCIRRANKLVCTSPQIAADLKRVHPSLTDDKISIITNGFDGEINAWTWQKKSLAKAKFVIGYVGSFYYKPELRATLFNPWWKKAPHRMIQYSPRKEDWLYRSPYFFFKAVAALLKEFPCYKERLSIKFAGTKDDWIDDQIALFGLQDNCEFVGFLNHDEVIKFQHACDALLLTSSKVIGGRDYSIAGKTYEYFTIGKPIVGFVCEGAQKDILEPSGVSVICDPDDEKQAAGQLKLLFDGKIDLTPNYAYMNSFGRKILAEKLSVVMKSVMVK